MRLFRKTGTALMLVDDVVDNLPFIVRRDHRIVAAFARKAAVIDWAECAPSTTRAGSRCIPPKKSSTLIRTARQKSKTTMNRRLVPMPPPRPAPLPPQQHAIFPKRRAVPPLSWPPKNYDVMAFIFTVCIRAVLWEYRHVIFLIVAIYVLGRVWFWLCRRHPLVAWFIFGFIRGLMGRR